jgi:hypothetical protein
VQRKLARKISARGNPALDAALRLIFPQAFPLTLLFYTP